MARKPDPYPVVCMLMTMLKGHKRMGYEVIDAWTNQSDDLELVISGLNGTRMRVVLKATVHGETLPAE
jgi:hypothetical protein